MFPCDYQYWPSDRHSSDLLIGVITIDAGPRGPPLFEGHAGIAVNIGYIYVPQYAFVGSRRRAGSGSSS